MKSLTIADPLKNFDPQAETSSFIIFESQRRGYTNYIAELKDLFLYYHSQKGMLLKAKAKEVQIKKNNKKFNYKIVREKTVFLEKMDLIFLRKDPPVDEVYLTHLDLLERLEEQVKTKNKIKPFFINSPSGIKQSSEKIFPLQYPSSSPETLISFSKKDLLKFLKKHSKIVIKPLNQAGGRGIFILESKQKDQLERLKEATKNFQSYILAQKYIPEARKGDKRIVLIGDKPLGAFLRVPSKKDFRGNMHQGATWKKAKITAHEKKIIKMIVPDLLQRGLFLLGLDFLGPYLTEINSTSPMGFRECNTLYNSQSERVLLDFIENRIKMTKI